MACELASPPHEGKITLFSPSVRGRAAEGGRGSLTRHLEFGAMIEHPKLLKGEK
jgi:hypothetical protein